MTSTTTLVNPPGMRDLDTYMPKFDMAEHKDSYSLHGELPGVEVKDVEIEFSDPQVCQHHPFDHPNRLGHWKICK